MNFSLVAPTRRTLLAEGAGLLTLGGCGSLLGPSNPPPQIYKLEPAFAASPPGPSFSSQLVIAHPYASQTLDTARIALARGAAMDYYADAQWTDLIPRLVQSLLVQAFERSGRLPNVARESEGLRADYILATDIHEFNAQYAADDAPPTVVVDISVRMLEARGTVAASQEIHQSAPAVGNTVPSVIQAFDQAVGAALAQIVGWALQMQPAT